MSLDEKFWFKDGENLKKIFAIIFVLASVLLMSNFVSIGNTLLQATATSKIASAGILAPPSLFPTNATFETKAEVVGNHIIWPIGGTDGVDYCGQSFKALSDYIVDCALWLQSYSGTTPDLKLMLCNSTEVGWPNIAAPMFNTSAISGTTVDARPGRFYFNLTKPIRVQQNKTYWLIIDGYYDHTTSGAGASWGHWLTGGTYADGFLVSSMDIGATWTTWETSDLDFVVNFSNRPDRVDVFGVGDFGAIGGTSGPSQYFAQSFKALDAYIVDAGVWIAPYSGTTPNFKVQIWGTNVTGYPDKNNVIVSSRMISGSEINANPGRFFVHPNVSIAVTVGETYWVVIDGYSDHTTSGNAGSRWTLNDVYNEGYFLFSNDAGSYWYDVYDNRDLDFVVTFSASKSAIQVDGYPYQIWQGIGGNGTYNYLGQSFKALGKYITEASMWIGSYMSNAPTVRLLLCPRKTAADGANVTAYLAASIPITGAQIMSHSGHYYLNPPKPIEVIPGQTYYLLIDGWTYHTSANASVMTRYRYEVNMPNGPYTDGREYNSQDAGDTWWWSYTIDVDVDIRFSDVPSKAQCGSTDAAYECGWQALTPYFAQSFVALNDYITDAGIWLAPRSGTTPDFRLLLVENNATSYDHPDMTNILAMSMRITGTDITANSGVYYIKPPTPIPVQRLQKYWIVIDGSYDQVTVGTAGSRSVNYDAYPDGEFLWAYKNLNQGWHPDTVNQRYDLQFDVIFTHVNQPPTKLDVTIWPLKPFDSDDLTAWWPIPSTDLEEEPVTYYIEWYKNSILQPAWTNNIVVPNSATSPTDDWMVRVTPYDGHINGTANTYTVHVQADILTIDHPVTADSQTFHIFTTSNTTITGFTFSHAQQYQPANITFTSTGPAGAIGFCDITIPKSLMTGPWMIIVNGILIDPPKTENATHTTIQLEYLFASSVPIIIQGNYAVPEFMPAMLLITLTIATLAVAVVSKKINKRKQ
jgi:hypothetical protein